MDEHDSKQEMTGNFESIKFMILFKKNMTMNLQAPHRRRIPDKPNHHKGSVRDFRLPSRST